MVRTKISQNPPESNYCELDVMILYKQNIKATSRQNKWKWEKEEVKIVGTTTENRNNSQEDSDENHNKWKKI